MRRRWRRASRSLAAALLARPSRAAGRRRRSPRAAPSARPAAAGNRLNVLLVTIDTLRADHLGAYGYGRPTSPRIDALARRGVVFDQAYTYWPKTRGSFVAHADRAPRLAERVRQDATRCSLDFNPTLASVLKEAGYETAATVDNPNVAASLGYAKGFDRYRETWEEKALATEMDRTRAITADGVRYLGAGEARPAVLPLAALREPARALRAARPVGHAPSSTTAAASGPVLAPVDGFHGGVPRPWAKPGKALGWYVAQYDGEIAAVDAEVGQRRSTPSTASPSRDRTLVVVTSDHGESLGEHDYYFDHGENLFDPSMRIPLLVAGPGVKAGAPDGRARHDARPRADRPRRA